MRRLGACFVPLLASLVLSGPAVAASGSITYASCIAEAGAEGCTSGTGLAGLHGVVVSPDGKNVYVVGKPSATSGAIAWFQRDPTTGSLTESGCISELGADGCATGHGLQSVAGVAISPDGKSVYAVSDGSNAIVGFSRNASDGSLTYQGCISSPAADTCSAGTNLAAATGVVVSPDNKNVYTSAESSNAVSTFTRNTSTGALSQNGCVSEGGTGGCTSGHGLDHAENLVLSPNGAQLYATAIISNALVELTRNTTTGALSPAACINQAGDDGCGKGNGLTGADGIAISPDGTNIYTAAENGSALATFSRSATGTVSETTCVSSTHAGSDSCPTTAPGLYGLARVAVSPDGASVYAGAYFGYTIATFNRAGDGSLTSAGCVAETGVSGCATMAPGLKDPAGLTLSPDGKNVYDAAKTSNAIDVFQRTLPTPPPPSATTGAATSLTPHTATLNGSVNPNGSPTTYYFQIGRTTSYAETTPGVSAGAGTSSEAVGVGVADLTAQITYHYRVVAVNAGGTTYGSDRTFTTPLASPTGLAVKVKPHRARHFPYRYTLTGKLGLPAGVSKGQVCGGHVTIVVTRGRHRILRRSASLSSTCTWKTKLKFGKRRQVPGHGKLTIEVSFPETQLLAAYNGKPLSVRYG